MSRVQQLRKKGGVNAEDKVQAWYETDGKELQDMITAKAAFIKAGTIYITLLFSLLYFTLHTTYPRVLPFLYCSLCPDFRIMTFLS